MGKGKQKAQRGLFALVRDAAKDFTQDEAPVRAAALAYYTTFALPPLLVLLLMIAGLVWDPRDVQQALTGQFRNVIGAQGAQQIQTIIAQADRPGSGGAVATVLSIAGLLFGATGAFLQLQRALDRAWEVKPDPAQGGVKSFVLKRLLSLGFVLGLGFLLAVSLALTAAISAIGGAIPGVPTAALEVLTSAATFAVLALLFAAMFKILPDAETEWRDVWVGGAVTALLFVIGKFALGFYLGRGDKGDAFGAAGSLAVVLLWIYYAGMIVLFGAEFTQKWANRRGGGVRPEKGAVKVVEEERVVERGGAPKGGAGKHRGGGPQGTKPQKQEPSRAPKREPAHTSASTRSSGAPGKGGMLLALSLLFLRMRGRKS